MSIPINVEDLISGRAIESYRLEFKKGWNPEKILHTVCAFANDFEESGSGYIIIGVSDEGDGRPKDIVGITDSESSRIQSELFRICNFIEPRYIPTVDEVFMDDKRLIVIKAVVGRSRPYKCPVSLHGGERGNSEKGYYIRRMSNTIRANREEELELLRFSSRIGFDEEANNQATIGDLSRGLMDQYLRDIGSRIDLNSYDMEDLCESMRIVDGPKEDRHPLNVGLMMFNSNIEEYFPYSRIELVVKPDPTGEGMDEKYFTGSVYNQLTAALAYMRSFIITARTFKIDGQAEALRVFNYPYEALEEILVNAVYHRDYRIHQQVTVTVTPECLEVLSYPGPDYSISDEDLKDLKMRSKHQMNKRLGDFLKELKLAEARNTGIPKVVASLKKNGSPMPIYETDAERSYLAVTLPVHELFAVRASHGEGSENVRSRIIGLLETEGCMKTSDICEALGYKPSSVRVRNEINRLIDEGALEYLYPDSPRDPRQRICLPKGRKVIS